MIRRIPRGPAALVAVLAACFALVAAAAPAQANEPIAEGAPLSDFVEASKPEWNFARANNNDPCWPEEAIHPDGVLNSGAEPDEWPNSDNECSPQGTVPFPTYYSVEECNDSEIRVGYTIYIPNSGFAGGAGLAGAGHRHDFEGILVEWRRDGEQWFRSELLMGRHGKYIGRPWAEAESWSGDWTTAGLGREYPRIFVGWGSHAMFNDQGGLKDVISQYTDNEYRAGDYPVNNSQLVQVTEDNELGQRFSDPATEAHFGSANTHPAVVAQNLCAT